MFKKLNRDIDALDDKRAYLDADWDPAGSKALLGFYVKIMPKALNAERCSIFIYDPATKEIWLKAGTGMAEREIRVGKDAPSIVGEVVDTGRHAIVTGLEDKNGAHKKVDSQTGFVTRDVLAIPIKSLDGKQVTGAVEVLNKKEGSFTEEDRKLLEEMAHYLELTMENIYFNIETANVLRNMLGTLTKGVSMVLWIIGFAALAIIGRVLWVGLRYTVS